MSSQAYLELQKALPQQADGGFPVPIYHVISLDIHAVSHTLDALRRQAN